MKRDIKIDIFKGILILFVVIGHFNSGITHDIIFLFHMPLFFILSGFFLEKEKLTMEGYLANKSLTLLIPYCTYLFLDFFLIRQDYSFNSFMHMVYGGRSISGVYWYITCFLFTLVLFTFISLKITKKIVKCLIFVGGV